MKILEIKKIKNKNDLKKFDINNPLFLDNYLFHYIIMINNCKNLKLAKFPIYKENSEGLNGFHLAAKVANETGDYSCLKLLIKEYSEYVLNLNKNKENFLNYLGVSNTIIDLVNSNNKINWIKLFSNISNTGSYLNHIFLFGSAELINFIINKFKFNWMDLNDIPFFELPFNKKLNNDNIISILDNLGDDNIRIIDKEGKTIIYSSIISKKMKVLEYLYKKNLSFDKYIPIYTFHPFTFAYNLDINKGDDFKVSKFIWSKIKETHNFSFTNKFKENIAFSILLIRMKQNKGCYELEIDICKRNTDWNSLNIYKKNPLYYLIQLDYNKYANVLSKDTIIDISNIIDNKSILDYAKGKWLKLLKSLPCKNKNDDIKINNYSFVDYNLFTSTFLDVGLYLLYFQNKYKKLYIPKYLKKYNHKTSNYEFPEDRLNIYNNFPWIIFWKDKNNYYIHPYLNSLINKNIRNGKYNYAFVILSITLPNNGLHATILYYDFINKFIERFDPYGNSFDLDIDLDPTLEEILTKDTGLTYINVRKYLPVAGFQNISDENNPLYQKPGDFGGYCLGWCFWYLEHRILNYKYQSKELVIKLINKLIEREDNFMEYIRNYSNYINKYKNKQLLEIGIDRNRISNISRTTSENDLIFEYIKNKLTIH